MSILRAYAVPHPPLIIPAVGHGDEKQIADTIAAFDEISKEIAALAPETIIFITPHSTVYADYFHISPGQGASGNFARYGAPQVYLEAKYDQELAGKITQAAEANAISAGSAGEREASLDHGVMIPMWFINRHYQNYQIVRISQSGFDAAEHYRFGQCIFEAVEDIGCKAVLIASGDLSHRLTADGPYGFAKEGPVFDQEIVKIFSAADFLSLFKMSKGFREGAAECGYNSFMVMAGCFNRQEVKGTLYSYEGPFGVGYAVAGFEPGKSDRTRNFLDQYMKMSAADAIQSKSAEDSYRALARQSLEYCVKTGDELPLPGNLPEELLTERSGVFVSLHKNGQLRGCIGTIMPTTGSIAQEIIQNAVSAGLSDTRFAPVGVEELPLLTYKVDVLLPPEPISGPEELDVKRYGVIVSKGYKRGLLLPNLEGIDTVADQIAIARRKGGIPEDAEVKLERFEVIRHE